MQKGPRIIFDTNSAEGETIDSLLDICRLKTRTELIREAVAFFAWVIEEKQQGRIVVSCTKDFEKFKEVECRALRHIAKKNP